MKRKKILSRLYTRLYKQFLRYASTERFQKIIEMFLFVIFFDFFLVKNLSLAQNLIVG